MKKIRLYNLLMSGMMLVSFSACNGILDGIYDDQETNVSNGFGFIEVNDAEHSGTIYIDASDYEKWIYIDLHAQAIDSTRIMNEEGAEEPLGNSTSVPTEWDFAVHRYDTKTNGGMVLETGSTGFDVLVSAGKIPEGTYVADISTTDKITIDMSGMMDGNILYAQSNYNSELSKWLNVDTSTMPPIYTQSNKVYVIKLKDGTHAAIKLTDFKNEKAVKGYMTIEYVYPLEQTLENAR